MAHGPVYQGGGLGHPLLGIQSALRTRLPSQYRRPLLTSTTPSKSLCHIGLPT